MFDDNIELSNDNICDYAHIYFSNIENKYLSKYIKKILSIPASSISSERLFSKTGSILTFKRTNLQIDMINKLVFIKLNKYLKQIE